MDGLPVAHHLHLLIGDVDEDIIAAEIVIHPALALEIEFHLPDAVGNRHIERFERVVGNDAVGGEAVAGLELSRRDESASRDRLVIGVGGKIASYRQPCPERRNARVGACQA